MKITFVGTGSGKASLSRYYSSIYIEEKKNNLLIDTGDGISRALLAQNISYNTISNILITHLHADHFSGLFSLLTQMKLSGRKKPLTIYIDRKLKNILENFLYNSYLFPEKMKFSLKILPVIDKMENAIGDKFFFKTFLNTHIIPKNYPSNYSSVKFISNSVLIGIADKNIIYTSDIGKPEDITIPEMREPDILIIETTHVTFGNLEIIFDFLNPGRIYLNHISDENLPLLKKWHSGLSAKTNKRIMFAEDGMIIK